MLSVRCDAHWLVFAAQHIMIDLGTGNNNKVRRSHLGNVSLPVVICLCDPRKVASDLQANLVLHRIIALCAPQRCA